MMSLAPHLSSSSSFIFPPPPNRPPVVSTRRLRRCCCCSNNNNSNNGNSPPPSISSSTLTNILNSGVIACLRAQSADVALEAARAAITGGISVLEIVVSTPGVFEVLHQLVQDFPTTTLGVGTILNIKDAENAKIAGAKFIMSPAIVKGILDQGSDDLLYIPGVMTPTEVLSSYNAGAKIVKGYFDVDWAGCPDDHSTGGFAIYLGSNLISWSVRKQRTISRSSIESEYKALVDMVAALTWLEAFLDELGISIKLSLTPWCDNLGAMYVSAIPSFMPH